jgi:hypothetical protein
VFSLVATPGWRSGFTPAALFPGGVQGAWYDPSDVATLAQDSAGTTPVTADGDPVGRMLDKSGNGWHLTQATSGNRPTYRTGSGLSWLEFDGVDDFLLSAGTYTFALPEYIAVCISKTAADTRGFLGCIGGSTAYHYVGNSLNFDRARDVMRGPAAEATATAANNSVPTTGVVKVIDGLGQAGTHDIFVNNGSSGSASNAFNTTDTGTNRIVGIGPVNSKTSGPATACHWYGGLIVQAEISAVRAAIVTWLGAKGGLSL